MKSLEDTLPVPELTALTSKFWTSAKQRKLVLQYCENCKTQQSYPKAWCSECGSEELIWRELSGKGTVYSYTIPRLVADNSPAFREKLPFIVAIIELKEGARIYSNIVGIPPEEVKIGMEVEVIFEDASPDIALPKFRVVGSP